MATVKRPAPSAAKQQQDAADPLPGAAVERSVCVSCGREKAPIGRDVAPAAYGAFCTDECYAYRWPPTPPQDWPA
jgi:hypothetical protein